MILFWFSKCRLQLLKEQSPGSQGWTGSVFAWPLSMLEKKGKCWTWDAAELAKPCWRPQYSFEQLREPCVDERPQIFITNMITNTKQVQSLFLNTAPPLRNAKSWAALPVVLTWGSSIPERTGIYFPLALATCLVQESQSKSAPFRRALHGSFCW